MFMGIPQRMVVGQKVWMPVNRFRIVMTVLILALSWGAVRGCNYLEELDYVKREEEKRLREIAEGEAIQRISDEIKRKEIEQYKWLEKKHELDEIFARKDFDHIFHDLCFGGSSRLYSGDERIAIIRHEIWLTKMDNTYQNENPKRGSLIERSSDQNLQDNNIYISKLERAINAIESNKRFKW